MKTFGDIINEQVLAYEKIIDLSELNDLTKVQIKTNWLGNIILMEYLTKKHYRIYNCLNLTIIIGGILIPVLLNLISDPISSKITVTIVGVLVAICSGVSQSYKTNDRWRHFRFISQQLKIEGEQYFSLSGDYKSFLTLDKEAFQLFMTNVKKIKQDQIERYMKRISNSNMSSVHNDIKP